MCVLALRGVVEDTLEVASDLSVEVRMFAVMVP